MKEDLQSVLDSAGPDRETRFMSKAFFLLWAGLFIFIAVIVYSFINVASVARMQDEQDFFHRTNRAANTVEDRVISAETAWSNYYDTGDPKYIDDFNAAVTSIRRSMEQLGKYLSGDPSRKILFDNTKLLVDSRINIFRELFEAGRPGNLKAETDILMREEIIHNALIMLLGRIERETNDRIFALDFRTDVLTDRSIYSLALGGLLSVIIFGGLAYLLNRELRARTKAEGLARSELNISNLLLRATRALSYPLTLQEKLDSLVEVLLGVKRESRIIISLFDRNSGEFTVAASHGPGRRRHGVSFRFEEIVPGFRELFRDQGSVLVDFEAPGITEAAREKAQKTLCRLVLACPLMTKNELRGFLSIDMPGKRMSFSERERQLIESISVQAAVTMEHARLYEEAALTRDELEESNRKFLDILNSITDSYFALDYNWRFLEVNPSAEKNIFGRHASALIGRAYGELFPEAADSEFYRRYELAIRDRSPAHFEARSGIVPKWFEAHVYPRADRMEVYLRDITERKEAERSLHESMLRQKAILDNIPDVAWLKDRESRFIAVNEPFARLTGRTAEDLAGKTDLDVWPKELAQRYRADDFEVMETGRRKKVEEPLSDGTGSLRFIETVKTPIFSDSGEVIGTTGIARDITERKNMEDLIRQQALHDPLTGLPNRTLFLDHFALALNQAYRNKGRIALLFLDLDRFKAINDTLGHDIGDKLLQAVGSRLRAGTRETDTIARLGGDEFTILMPRIDQEEEAAWMARKIISQLETPFIIEGKELSIGASIGISIYPDDGRTESALMKSADAALYFVKEHGRNNYQFFNPEINENTERKMLLERGMRRMIGSTELELLYQPLIDAGTGGILCAEALVRWRHPELGLLSPGQFIPVSEETGLILQIEEWVLRAACAQARKWQQAGYSPFCVTVNISSRGVRQPDFVCKVVRILEETGLDGRFLGLEIKEDAAMAGEQALQNIGKLNELGINISIDDFGTGYASLRDLREVPVQTLKIDGSFITRLGEDRDQQAMVSAIIDLAHVLKKRAVAEGVENKKQQEFLASHHCDALQGFLFGNPVPPEEFVRQWITVSG